VVQSGGAFLGTPGYGGKGLPQETKEEDPGFQLEEWLLEQFKTDALLMEKRDPFWSNFVTQPPPPPGKKKPKHRDGPFSWLVRLGKLVLGESNLDKIRGSLIAKHSQVITTFCVNYELSAKVRGNLTKVAKKNGEELGFLV
jgi:hypothetical protein